MNDAFGELDEHDNVQIVYDAQMLHHLSCFGVRKVPRNLKFDFE